MGRCGLPMTEPPEFGDCVVSSRPPLLYEYRVMGERQSTSREARWCDRGQAADDHRPRDRGARRRWCAALTHQAVDRHAGLPASSTSYYFRTRAALIAAVVERIRVHSRTAFDNAQAQSAGPSPPRAAALIAGQLRNLTGERWDQALAVFALLGEVRSSRNCVMR